MVDPKDETPEMREARRVDELASRVPTTEQSARENAGITRRPPDGRPSMIGVSDTPRAAPKHQHAVDHHHPVDPSHRGEHKIQGEEIEVTKSQDADRQPEKTHL